MYIGMRVCCIHCIRYNLFENMHSGIMSHSTFAIGICYWRIVAIAIPRKSRPRTDTVIWDLFFCQLTRCKVRLPSVYHPQTSNAALNVKLSVCIMAMCALLICQKLSTWFVAQKFYTDVFRSDSHRFCTYQSRGSTCSWFVVQTYIYTYLYVFLCVYVHSTIDNYIFQ